MIARYRPVRAPVYFTCEASASDPALGTVQGGGTYLEGNSVTVTAKPENRAVFTGWTDSEGRLLSQDESYTFAITGNVKLTAQFVRLYAVLVSVEPNDSGSAQGAGDYRQGQEAVLTASPAEGYLFTGWAEGGETVDASPEYRFIVDSDRNLTAQFAVRCVVTLLPGLEGAGTATGAGAYAYGAKVTLTASPNEGYRFLGWQNDAGEMASASGIYSFVITEDVSFTPLFEAYASPLPLEYYELEYIGNTNLGYVDAEITNGNLRGKELFVRLALQEGASGTILGGHDYGYYRSGSSYLQYCYANILTVKRENGLTALSLRYGYTSTSTAAPQSVSAEESGSMLEIATDFNTYLTVNGVRAAIASNTNNSTRVNRPTANGILSLSSRYQYSSTGFTPTKGAGALDCQLYRLNLGEYEFIPAQNPEGIAGLYELSTNTFYPSSKEDAPFTAGPIIAAGTKTKGKA